MYWNFGRRPDDWRAFFLKYQDRIIYGTDNMNLYDAREIENARITNDLQRGFLMSTAQSTPGTKLPRALRCRRRCWKRSCAAIFCGLPAVPRTR